MAWRILQDAAHTGENRDLVQHKFDQKKFEKTGKKEQAKTVFQRYWLDNSKILKDINSHIKSAGELEARKRKWNVHLDKENETPRSQRWGQVKQERKSGCSPERQGWPRAPFPGTGADEGGRRPQRKPAPPRSPCPVSTFLKDEGNRRKRISRIHFATQSRLMLSILRSTSKSKKKKKSKDYKNGMNCY